MKERHCYLCNKLLTIENSIDEDVIQDIEDRANFFGEESLTEIEQYALFGICEECFDIGR